MIALVSLGLAAAVAAGAFVARWMGVANAPMISLAILVVVALVSVPLVMLANRRLDEVAREAHRFAWYHGGSWGAVQGLLLVMAIAALAPRAWLAAQPPGALLIDGAMIVSGVQVAAYLIVWAGWWLRHR